MDICTLYRAGVLSRRKEGNMVYYTIQDQTCVALCKSVCNQIAGRMEEETISRRTVRGCMPLQ